MARILVIDDDPRIRETVSRLLEARGHAVRVVEDGADGINSIAQSTPDLVITDVFMPGKDGIQTLIELRKAFPKLKIIVMSGGDSTGLMNLLADAEMLGANRTLSKPFTPEELLKAVDTVLRG